MKLLLVASTTGYQVRSFASAAERVGAELVLATDRCHILDDPWGDRAIAVRFDDAAAGLEALAARGPFDGIVAVGDRPALAASLVAERLGLRFSPPGAVRAAGNKLLSRLRFQSAGLLTPRHALESAPGFPCVLKPLDQAASRGVIRADDQGKFAEAHARIKRMTAGATVLAEEFIPGREFALEGLVTTGTLQILAVFEKPDPLDGPFFEETIYLTPPRGQDTSPIADAAELAVRALGLTDGPIHAEMRVNERGVWMLEVAARPIGGLCSRVLRFADDVSFEELLLRHAAGQDVSGARLATGAHGVMMIPVPRAGVFDSVTGIDRARALAGVEDLEITVKEGQVLEPLPEGSSYTGFIFARGNSPAEVERTLRAAHACLDFQVSSALPVVR
jgi:biotin carboxylase